ncbi:MAG: DUF2461 family protein [Actinomycetota bacterium]
MTDTFAGYPADTLSFLEELGGQDKAWFDANRSRYQASVVEPTKALVAGVGARLAASLAPDISAEPRSNGSISPINNDRRFAPDKPPYKDHVLLRFWEGPSRKTSPTLFLRIGVEGIGYGVGAALPDLDRWRALIDDDATGGPLASAITVLGTGRALDVDGAGYKRVPKPFAEDHPRAALLRHKAGFQARWVEPVPASIGSARFVDHCMTRLEACAPIHRWLVTNL